MYQVIIDLPAVTTDYFTKVQQSILLKAVTREEEADWGWKTLQPEPGGDGASGPKPGASRSIKKGTGKVLEWPWGQDLHGNTQGLTCPGPPGEGIIYMKPLLRFSPAIFFLQDLSMFALQILLLLRNKVLQMTRAQGIFKLHFIKSLLITSLISPPW